jgi:hypothetical protein
MMLLRLLHFISRHAVFLVCLAFFAGITLHNVRAVSYTGDEEIDLDITHCLMQTKNPFVCDRNPSQSRLAYYVHAVIATAAGDIHTPWHYYFSAAVGAGILLIVYRFSRMEFGSFVANSAVLLMATSIPFLAGSRLLLSHSNIVLTLFQTLSFMQLYYYVKTPARKYLVKTATYWGFSVSSSLLALFNLPLYVAIFAVVHRKQRGYRFMQLIKVITLFSLLSAMCFFITSPFYLIPDNVFKTYEDIKFGTGYWYWNYLSQHLLKTPFYFSALTFVLKIGPWWAVPFLVGLPLLLRKQLSNLKPAQRIFFLWFYLLVWFIFCLKSVVFRYEAPHHQLYLYPLVFVGLAMVLHHLVRRWPKVVLIGMVLGVTLSVRDVFTFFPEYLFYGAQYGREMIGEIYGPAVLLCQDQAPIYKEIARLESAGGIIAVADRNCLRMPNHHAVLWRELRLSPPPMYYAYVDYLHHSHLSTPPDTAYYTYVFQHCVPVFERKFPTGVTIYALYQCNDSRGT